MLNPGEYDHAKLRSLADGQSPAAVGAGSPAQEDGRSHPDEVVRSRQRRRLLRLARAAPTPTERPYLPRIPGGTQAELLALEWVEYLRDRAGRQGASAALGYYARIGWLGDDAAATLGRHLGDEPDDGLPPGLTHADGRRDDDTSPAPTGGLRPADHRTGLTYVLGLAALADDTQN
ncbi:MAG: FlaD/FlaE family flagellar protein [Halolamina sp.]